MNVNKNNRVILLFVLTLVVIALIAVPMFRGREFSKERTVLDSTSDTALANRIPVSSGYHIPASSNIAIATPENPVPTKERIIENIKKLNDRNQIAQQALAELNRRACEVSAKIDRSANNKQGENGKKVNKPTKDTLDKTKSGQYLIVH